MSRPDPTPPELVEVRCAECSSTWQVGINAHRSGRPLCCPDCGAMTARRPDRTPYPFKPAKTPGAGLKPNPWLTPREMRSK